MGSRCSHCGKEIFLFDRQCPFCGQAHAVQPAEAMTLEGLRAACARAGIVPEVYHLTIGQETAFPGTGAIYADEQGTYILMRVRGDGTREILSEGTEERPVAEAFVSLLREEWQKKHPGYHSRSTDTGDAPVKEGVTGSDPLHAAAGKAREKADDQMKLRTRVLWAAFLILVMLAVFYYFKADKNAGYYTVNGVTYVYYDSTWYTGEGSEWTPTETPEGFSWEGDWEYDTITEGGFADSPYYQQLTWSSLWKNR